MYYNTTHIEGDALDEANRLTSEQDKKVYQLFLNHPERNLTSHDVEDLLVTYPRSSIVRSINTLTNKGLLCKTNTQVIGKYGKLVHTWILSKSLGQLTMF